MPADRLDRDRAALLDIAHATDLALEFCEEMSKDEFVADKKSQSAVLHQILIIGEATKRLSESFRRDQAEVPWQQIAGMRDRLIHGYDDVDIDQVWLVIERDLPELKARIGQLLPDR